MSGPFKRISVETHFHQVSIQRSLITWAMSQDFDAPGPWVFLVQRALSPSSDEWEDVAQTIDQPWAYDPYPLSNHLSMSYYYRIKLTDGDGATYTSQSQTSASYWNRYDWTLAKEIVRKESLILQKKAGIKGWLLKRRTWGDQCPVCTNTVTGQIENSHCSTCYSTGYVGGYYAPLDYWLIMNADQRLTKLDSNVGLKSDVLATCRGLAYPTLDANDVWVSSPTNTRYIVMPDIQAVAKHRGVDLIVNFRLSELPTTHIIYDYPTPCKA